MNQTQQNMETVAQSIIELLKQHGVWESDIGLVFNNKLVTHKGEQVSNQNIGNAYMRIWFEGIVYKLLNYKEFDGFKLYNELTKLMETHGYYWEFNMASDLYVYKL